MKKTEFLGALHDRLSGLPKEDAEERLAFYSEMIDDRMEDGLSEEAAVAQIGDVDEIAAQVVADTPLSTLVRQAIKPKRRMRVWEIVLLAVGSPIWLSLLIAVLAVAVSVYAVLWSAVISLWAVFASLAACGLGGILGGIVSACWGKTAPGMVLIAAGLVCAGLSVFMFCGCKAATTGLVWLTNKIAVGIKHRFIKKEVHHG